MLEQKNHGLWKQKRTNFSERSYLGDKWTGLDSVCQKMWVELETQLEPTASLEEHFEVTA
jgi:hypothetical protein